MSHLKASAKQLNPKPSPKNVHILGQLISIQSQTLPHSLFSPSLFHNHTFRSYQREWARPPNPILIRTPNSFHHNIHHILYKTFKISMTIYTITNLLKYIIKSYMFEFANLHFFVLTWYTLYLALQCTVHISYLLVVVDLVDDVAVNVHLPTKKQTSYR